MASSLHRWESDTLLSAAETVQDSADRMESIFRLLLHEQGLVHGGEPDLRLLKSMEHHRRDLATILETTKWQLEDFERAVNTSSANLESHISEDVIFRHKQFVVAIREQINNVEKSLDDSSLRYSPRKSEWVDLNEQDRGGLALFLSGGFVPDRGKQYATDNGSILKRYLDPATVTGSVDDTTRTVESKGRIIEKLNTNGIPDGGHHFALEKDNLRNVASSSHARLALDIQESLQDTSCDGSGEHRGWDLEADEARPRTLFHRTHPTGFSSRVDVSRFLNCLQNAFGNRVARAYTKKLKDGEEQRDSPSYVDAPLVAGAWNSGIRPASGCGNIHAFFSRFSALALHFTSQIGVLKAGRQRFASCSQICRCVQLVLTVGFILVVLGLLIWQL